MIWIPVGGAFVAASAVLVVTLTRMHHAMRTGDPLQARDVAMMLISLGAWEIAVGAALVVGGSWANAVTLILFGVGLTGFGIWRHRSESRETSDRSRDV